MKIILGGRQTGRTKELIEMAAELEAKGEVSYIVCGTQEQAYSIAQTAKELNLNIEFPITYDDFLYQKYYAFNVKHFLIDNADHMLQHMTRVHIAAIVLEEVQETV